MQAWLVNKEAANKAMATEAANKAMATEEAANKATEMDPLFEAANNAMAMEAANNAMAMEEANNAMKAANIVMEEMAKEAGNFLNVDADSNSAGSNEEKMIPKQPAMPPPESLQYGGCKQG